MKLIEFLRARLDEDDEVAQETRKNEQRVPGTDRWFDDYSHAIVSMAPHRAVAEVDAKRRIVAAAEEYSPELEHGDNGEWALDLALRALALPYAEHPDYDEAWRP